jgi:FixJ family two-component response regulator
VTTLCLVVVVDDDESIRESLPDLLRELGYRSMAFESAEAFLASGCVQETGCLVLDITMPGGLSGPELRRELVLRNEEVPIVFITADRPRLGSWSAADQDVQCLIKPFSEASLLKAIRTATVAA